MKTKPTKKKWTRTEWLLLLAPLVVVLGIGAMNFAPQLGRAWQEWREYRSNPPYAILRQQIKSEKPLEPSFGLFTFSPDGQQIAISETLSNGSGFGNPAYVWLWRLGAEKPFSSWLASELKSSASRVEQLRYLDNRTIAASTVQSTLRGRSLLQSSYNEKRDAKNGHLISRQSLKQSPKRDVPAAVEFITPSDSTSPKFIERKKDGDSVKVSFLEAAMQPPKDDSIYPEPKYVKVRFFAEVADVKARSKHRFELAAFNDTRRKHSSSDKKVGVAFSPDLRFLFLLVQDEDQRNALVPDKTTVEVIDTRSQTSLWRQNYNDYWIGAVVFSSRGLFAISDDSGSGHGDGSPARSTRTELRSVQTGQLLRVLQKKGINGYADLTSMQFSPDGKLLAVPQDDRLELWDVSDLN